MKQVAIIGAGPAGLMAAEAALEGGARVVIYDAMPSAGRKLLMAGKSGLNITHSEDEAVFRKRYDAPDARLAAMVEAFGPPEIVKWMVGLGIEAHVGSSGRVFPVGMKASPLLRRWLARLGAAGAELHTRHRWTGWDETGGLVFETLTGRVTVQADAAVLALGGASWKRLGSDGAWAAILAKRGVVLEPFAASNCGFAVPWTDKMRADEGAPVKGVALSAHGQTVRGDFVITRTGIESGAVYPLAAALRRDIAADGRAILIIDLLPDTDESVIAARLAAAHPKDSFSNRLRKAVRLEGVKAALLHEVTKGAAPRDAARLARLIKSLPLTLTGAAPIETAISTSGGVPWTALDDALMLKALPGVYCAGEMIAWDAPTGGYLLTACLATGRVAGRAAAES
ncbi:MAG: TIGR03862 family flavoprotein [Hyphomonas sp.]|uniref:TIGR03862 family flavoprotein n=1 Tax=Hyphomonas sp. TaxID=87 RepID=UPI00182BED27|nr:TIGR03862 family flavoprotein [Hyphomonas sp.]MBA3067710.1 TIGR03862 family flavoprotein [Hyphomonas sp.]MBU4062203.1 TIGR03862 family flavoprotein [Alphaproteobacteria bacterium]MBU4165638.1 TIGR03862 family flavoprotein [Alphaproteobacteria bacterium]MBU4567685.1 TIGR03862 family flavoprotein [Alphaproteobacteria bacterium]